MLEELCVDCHCSDGGGPQVAGEEGWVAEEQRRERGYELKEQLRAAVAARLLGAGSRRARLSAAMAVSANGIASIPRAQSSTERRRKQAQLTRQVGAVLDMITEDIYSISRPPMPVSSLSSITIG
jgi:hypothetical protein